MVSSRDIRLARPFAEIFAKTNYSFLEGASHPEEVVLQAKELGYGALGVCDRNGVYGTPRSHVAAKEVGLRLLIGTEVSLDGKPAFLVARNRSGYGDLCELLTWLHTQGEEPAPVTAAQVFEKSSHLHLILPSLDGPTEILGSAKDAFGRRLWLAAHRFFDGTDDRSVSEAERLAKHFGVPVLATNRPLFHIASRKSTQDVLTCIRHTCTLDEGGLRLLANRERHLKTPEHMAQLFPRHRHWLEATLLLAGDCSFSLDEIRYRYPNEWLPPGETTDSYLRKLVEKGLERRYPGGVPEAARQQVERELVLIDELQYADYFLTIWDIVEFARSRGILCQGRGSAANSSVCYVLGITSIDPIRLDLLFERFLSKERHEPPDIDIDFEHERREEVIQYIYERYGRDRAAITAENICFRRKSVLREVAKVFEISLPSVEKILTVTHKRSLSEVPLEEIEAADPAVGKDKWEQYFAHCRQISGFPRHLGTHVGGFVLCQEKLTRNVPVENAAMEKRTIVQWDKNDLDSLGFVRVDILGLGILTCLRKCFEYLREKRGVDLTLATIPAEDPKVYDMLCEADSVGVFQIESRAQMSMLPRLKPRNFYDLVVEISLVRPGPIQGDMVHPYLRRRSGQEKVEYPHPDLKAILHKTYGVPIFQEQIMKIAMVVAGFSGGQADELRRAMGIWRRDGKNHLSRLGERFRAGLIAKGIAPEFAQRIFSQIEGFAEYGFPESHAASFAVIAYASAYLRYYYPDAYLAALLNAQPMGFYATHTLVHDAQRHGVRVLGIDVNESDWDNRLEDPGIVRLGMREITGLAEKVGRAIEGARPYRSLLELIERVPTCKRDLFRLAGANAFESLGLSRRDAFWEIQGLLLREPEFFAPSEGPTELRREGGWERIVLDYEAQRVSLFSHPMAYLRSEGQLVGVVPSVELKHLPQKKKVKVAGLVISRQMPPTASGVLFITLEDELGFTNLVIWNDTYQRYKEPLITQSFLVCEGKIEKTEGGRVIHVIVDSAAPLILGPKTRSHDWG
jgi:error-prone DNA polymerase